MERYRRDFFISRIDAGYLRWRVNDDLTLRINPPTKDLIYESNEVYIELYSDIEFDDMLDEAEAVQFMMGGGVWSDKMQQDLDKLPDNIETLKLELFEAMYKKGTQKKLRKYINVSKKEQERLSGIKHSWDHYTKHGLASFARWQYILNKSVKYQDGSDYDWKHINTLTALSYYQSQFIPEDTIRELSHTEPWSNMWEVRKLNSHIFDGNITMDQMRLASWSNMYDTVAQSPECPPRFVLEDHDMMDGWLISQRKERDKDQKKHEIEGRLTNEKISSSDEVFIKVKEHDKPEDIMSLNTPHAQAIVASRLKEVAKKGHVGILDFADMKQRLRTAVTQKSIATQKGT